ncbi:hypothetical protein GUJ93_ZPchr0007g6389 [Zizania palustris]|uniref:Uncharacterized protein n=1 Tax=Zizania palustris TaxID=103762 RepID=A0A8J5T1S5_ZIZPA|nr:hypothetical protein GUJ93_ZPchr0007g6389 [Zizania palustris]
MIWLLEYLPCLLIPVTCTFLQQVSSPPGYASNLIRARVCSWQGKASEIGTELAIERRAAGDSSVVIATFWSLLFVSGDISYDHLSQQSGEPSQSKVAPQVNGDHEEIREAGLLPPINPPQLPYLVPFSRPGAPNSTRGFMIVL